MVSEKRVIWYARNNYLRNGDEIIGVVDVHFKLTHSQKEWTNADACHMLWSHAHFSQETIHQVCSHKQHIARQVVPNFETTQNMCSSIACANCYFTILLGWEERLKNVQLVFYKNLESSFGAKFNCEIFTELTLESSGKYKHGWYFVSNASDSCNFSNSCSVDNFLSCEYPYMLSSIAAAASGVPSWPIDNRRCICISDVLAILSLFEFTSSSIVLHTE